jgi:hypothetical protein
MSRACMRDLAARHRIDADELTEAWSERAAIREYLAGFGRRTAELFAIGDVERMYQIGLHCPETRRRWTAGGDRVQPGRSAA